MSHEDAVLRFQDLVREAFKGYFDQVKPEDPLEQACLCMDLETAVREVLMEEAFTLREVLKEEEAATGTQDDSAGDVELEPPDEPEPDQPEPKPQQEEGQSQEE